MPAVGFGGLGASCPANDAVFGRQVMGLRRQRNYAGRWDVLIQQATQCLNRLIQIAARKKRNYILDQVGAQLRRGERVGRAPQPPCSPSQPPAAPPTPCSPPAAPPTPCSPLTLCSPLQPPATPLPL